MPNQLLISDANVIIDMDAGGLLEAMFRLPYTFATPRMLYQEELHPYFSNLVHLGLEPKDIQPIGVGRILALRQKYKGVGSNDLAALVLAEELQVPLITGDAKLRKACLEENVEIRGTIWLVGETVTAQIVSVATAKDAYDKMIADGSRLPQEEIRRQLREFARKDA